MVVFLFLFPKLKLSPFSSFIAHYSSFALLFHLIYSIAMGQKGQCLSCAIVFPLSAGSKSWKVEYQFVVEAGGWSYQLEVGAGRWSY